MRRLLEEYSVSSAFPFLKSAPQDFGFCCIAFLMRACVVRLLSERSKPDQLLSNRCHKCCAAGFRPAADLCWVEISFKVKAPEAAHASIAPGREFLQTFSVHIRVPRYF